MVPFIQSLKYKVILASTSPRRKQILEKLGLKFTVQASNFPEDLPKGNPRKYVAETALEKGKYVACNTDQPTLIISSDTIVVLEDKILEKPRDKQHAKELMKSYSNQKVQVLTAVSLLFNQQPSSASLDSITIENATFYVKSWVEETTVEFRELGNELIDEYIESNEWEGKAGGFGYQGDFGCLLIRRIDGCYYNVVGFPVGSFVEVLGKLVK